MAISWQGIVSLRVTELEEWFNRVKNPLSECPAETLKESQLEHLEPLVKVVSCDETDAIYRYDVKVSGGKKPSFKKAPFNGLISLTFASPQSKNEKYNFGMRSGKCLKLSMTSVQKIHGKFVNDMLEGEILITLDDKSFIKALAFNGILVGVKRHFDEDKSILSITNAVTNDTYLSVEGGGYFLFSCHQNENGFKRCILTRTMKENDMKSCIQLDNEVYVHCHTIDTLPNVSLDGCKILIDQASSLYESSSESGFSVWMKPNVVYEHTVNKDTFECLQDDNGRQSLEEWIVKVQDPFSFWHHFDANVEPLGSEGMIDITFDQFIDRPGFEYKSIVIQTISGQDLIKGVMINGQIRAKIPTHLANHPGWRGRLLIGLSKHLSGFMGEQTLFGGSVSNAYGDIVAEEGGFRFEQFATFSLKDGKLSGLVQIFGITSNDPKGHCSSTIFQGLAFIGRYKAGIPVGPCWKGLHGGSWIYGIVDDLGHFTGHNIAYVHQDLKLAMVGSFSNGLMVDGQEADIIGQSCNVDGIKVLEFGQPRGPIYHYQEPTNATFGDQPHVRDPLDKKYLYLKESDTFDKAGEGAFAAMDIPASTVFVLYGGMLYNEEQNQILGQKLKSLNEKHGWSPDDPEAEAQWKYKHTLSRCNLAIDIAPEFGPTSEFQGTLGHKVNHKFDPNTRYIAYESARFGLVNALMTIFPIKKDEEFFASYGYQFTSSPKWYRDLYRQFPKANPETIRAIDEFEAGLNQVGDGFSTPVMGGEEDSEKDDTTK